CRSHTAATVAASSASAPSGSASRTKSFWVPWPLVSRTPRSAERSTMPASLRAQQGDDALREVRSGRQPDDPRVTPEPLLLPASELPGGGGDGRVGLLDVEPALEDGDRLGVPDGAGGRPPLGEPGREEVARLVEEAAVEHGAGAGRDPGVELLAGDVDRDLDGGQVVAVLGQRGRERTPGELDDLQGPHDPPDVAGQDPRGGLRVPRGELGVERGGSVVLGPLLEPAPDLRVGARELELVEDGADVQPGAAAEHGAASPAVDG